MFDKLLAKADEWLPVLLEFHRGDENVSWHWVKSRPDLETLLANGPRAEKNEKPYVATIYPFRPVFDGMLDEKLFKDATAWARKTFAEGEFPFVVETESQWGYSAADASDFKETLDLFRGRPVVIGIEPDLSGDNGFTAKLP